MSDRQQKDGSGVLFRNKRKAQENHPDFTGTVTVDGKQRRIAGWLKVASASGEKFLSLAVSELRQQEAKPQERPSGGGGPAQETTDFEDDIPFITNAGEL